MERPDLGTRPSTETRGGTTTQNGPKSAPHDPGDMNQALLYSKHNALQVNDAHFVLDNYFRLIKWHPEGGDWVLDVGCGSGEVTLKMLLPLLPGNIGGLVASDVSEKMLEFARSQTKDPKVRFANVDIASDDLGIEHLERYDHVFSFYCLHWIQDQRQAFKNIYKALKPGGDILVVYLARCPIYKLYDNLGQTTKWQSYMYDYKKRLGPFYNCKDIEKYTEAILTEVGFSTHLCKEVKRNYTFASVEYTKSSLKAVNPFLDRIPDKLQNDYVHDLMQEVRKMKLIDCSENNNEGKVGIPYSTLVIAASKPLNG